MIKRIDVSVFEVIADLQKGRFESGVRVFGLAEGGIDYVYDEPTRGMIAPASREQVEALRQKIVAGQIRVDPDRGPDAGKGGRP
jgi:basic membrane protein A